MSNSIPVPMGVSTPKFATLSDGLELCKKLHPILKLIGLFPALTGGLLYKTGHRKDIDIVLYRHRQELDGFEVTDEKVSLALAACDVQVVQVYGFVTKAKWNGFDVDIFNPETAMLFDDEYSDGEDCS